MEQNCTKNGKVAHEGKSKIDWISFGYGFGSCGLIISLGIFVIKLL